MIKEKKARDKAVQAARDLDHKLKEAEQQRKNAEIAHMREQHVQTVNASIETAKEMAQREAYATHIAPQSAHYHADRLDHEYNARKLAEKKALMAEGRASAIEAQKIRLEFDIVEAKSSPESLSKERKTCPRHLLMTLKRP